LKPRQEKARLTALQEMNLKQIIDAGGVSLVIREDDVKYLPSLLLTGESNEEAKGKSEQ